MRLLPPANIPSQVLSIVVDLGPRSSGSGARTSEMLARVDRLVQLFHDFQFPATWAMDETAGHDLVERVLSSSAPHEIALRSDAAWSGDQAGRGTFSHGLARRVQQAESVGLEVTSICADEPIDRDHLDLLIKYGVDFVALTSQENSLQGNIRTLRFGLWEIAPAILLPAAETGWLNFGRPGRRTRGTLDQAISGETLCLAVVQAARLSERADLSGLDKLLRHAHRRHRQGVLSLQTLQTVSRQFYEQATSRGAGSILRAA